jgi:hypothetical protein
MTELPPDLARLGDELARATERRAAEQRRRRDRVARLAATGAAAVIAMAVLFPSAIDRAGSGGESPASASARVTYIPNACDQPRGATFVAARPCATPGATDVAALDRRYAQQ